MKFAEHIKLMFASHTELVSKHFGEISIAFALVGTFLSYLIGGWDKAIMVLLIMVSLDILTGCIKGFFVEKNFSSKRLREGFGTKVMYCIVIAVGNLLDFVFFEGEPILRMMACWFYIATEASSILENLAKMGVPIPSFITEKLEQIKEKIDNGGK